MSLNYLSQKWGPLQSLLKVIPLFEGMAHTVPFPEQRVDVKGDYYILELDAEKRQTYYHGFKKSQFAEAAKQYAEYEQRHTTNQNIQVVLVSVDSLEALKVAYPSYFFDTTQFVELIRECCDKT